MFRQKDTLLNIWKLKKGIYRIIQINFNEADLITKKNHKKQYVMHCFI